MSKALAAIATIIFLSGCHSRSSADGPTRDEVEKLLKKSFTNSDYATRQYELAVESIKRGAPRDGDHWTDGTPANKKRQVFPCRVVWTRATTYSSGERKVIKERFNGDYLFFRGDFDEWTFKLKNQETQKL